MTKARDLQIGDRLVWMVADDQIGEVIESEGNGHIRVKYTLNGTVWAPWVTFPADRDMLMLPDPATCEECGSEVDTDKGWCDVCGQPYGDPIDLDPRTQVHMVRATYSDGDFHAPVPRYLLIKYLHDGDPVAWPLDHPLIWNTRELAEYWRDSIQFQLDQIGTAQVLARVISGERTA